MYMKNKGPKMVKRLLQKAKKEDFLNQIFRPGGSDGKASAYSVGDLGSIPGLGKIPLEKVMAAHSSILAWRISMDRGAWRAAVHGVEKSRTQLSD